MTPVRRRGVARPAAAVLVSVALAAGAVGSAAAAPGETPPPGGGATATLAGGPVAAGEAVIRGEGAESERVRAGLFEMAVDGGGTLQTYGVDVHTETRTGARYREVPWEESSLHGNGDAGRILWILRNSYPQVNDFAALADASGAEELDEGTAAAGTQVAVWRFSDDAEVEAVDEDAEKLADYLERSARALPEPEASLTLEPAAVSGGPGERLGPVTVRTNAQSVTVTPGAEAEDSGVRILDEEGRAVLSAEDGDRLFFDVPEDAADGTASVSVQATTEVAVGRAFTSLGGEENRSQTQILAGSSRSGVSAVATAAWVAEGPSPAVAAEKNCAEGEVDVTAANKGDRPFTFTLAGEEHTVPAGESRTVGVPVEEDQAYDITVTGPDDFRGHFTGILDCRTAGPGGEEGESSARPGPATVGGTGAGGSGAAGEGRGSVGGGNLAATGSSSATPVIAAVAVSLVLLGAAVVLLARRRKPTAGAEGPAD